MDDEQPRPSGSALVLAARGIAEDLLAPAAAEVDERGVPRSHLDALGRAGLLGLHAPCTVGGADATADVVRRVQEELAAGDLSTWFVQVQHHAPVRQLAATGTWQDDAARCALLTDLATGRRVAGIAFSHLRRHPTRPLTVTATADGYRFDGRIDWYTGWSVNDLALLGGETDDGRVVFAFTPARPGAHLVGAPLRLAALAGTHTAALAVDGLTVGVDDVVAVVDAATWREQDRLGVANAVPAVFGLLRRAIALLEELAARRGEAAAADLAASLALRAGHARAHAYALADECATTIDEREELVGARLEARAVAHAVLSDAAAGVVVAAGGAGMATGHPAQLLAREALFLLVQASTRDGREAVLHALAAR